MTDTADRLAQLERQQAIQTDALRRILEGKWTGAEGAAGSVVALMGGRAEGFQPIDCPKDEGAAGMPQLS